MHQFIICKTWRGRFCWIHLQAWDLITLFSRLLIFVFISLNVVGVAANTFSVTEMAGGLKVPWGIDFLSNCDILVTERRGNLLYIDGNGQKHRISTGIDVFAKGQGGLLDVEIAKDFDNSRTIYMTFSYSNNGKTAGTAVLSAQLMLSDRKLTNQRRIFVMVPLQTGGRHFGSRIIEAPDGHLFVTIGERGDRQSAQNLTTHNGTVIRIVRDGSVPKSNPFINQPEALHEIWTYGHRNSQGAALDLDGNLWISEHGAKGGDEVNKIIAGRNYGWPLISYGRHYSGAKIGVGTVLEGMEQPELYWDPSIAPSGMMIYSGKLWPEWRGHIFVGSLKYDYISRINPEGGLREAEQIKLPETVRVRDVIEAPDGSIWFLSEGKGSVYRLAPLEWEPSDRTCMSRS